MLYKSFYNSPIGSLLLISNGTELTGLWIEQQKHYGSQYEEQAQTQDDLELFALVKKWLDCYFDGFAPDPSKIPLAPVGTPFQQAVWKILTNIPYGTTITYGCIAKQLAVLLQKKTMSAQAVGNAVGRNPISIMIPCHRVIGTNGSLTGYAGGLDRKLWLLQHEGCLPQP